MIGDVRRRIDLCPIFLLPDESELAYSAPSSAPTWEVDGVSERRLAWAGVDARQGWGYDAGGADGVGELRKGVAAWGIRSPEPVAAQKKFSGFFLDCKLIINKLCLPQSPGRFGNESGTGE